jgi:hypothetical protein
MARRAFVGTEGRWLFIDTDELKKPPCPSTWQWQERAREKRLVG